MGKKSKYPDYSTGNIVVNGKTVASTKRDKNNNIVGSSYNMSNTEKNIYNSVQKNLYNSLTDLFSVSNAQRKEWTNQINTLKAQGAKQIDNIYTPMETNLRNNIATRFGNLDNSVFLDNLNKITDKRAEAVAELSNNLVATQDQLYQQELANRINNISFLNNLNAAMNNNILNFTSAAMNNATSGNNYNNNAYNGNNQSSGLWTMLNQTANTMINAAGTAAKFMVKS